MTLISILTYLFGFISLIFAIVFLYYSIQNAKLMRDSIGRQIMAFGATFFLFAIITIEINIIIYPNYGTYLNSLIILFVSLFIFAYGFFKVGKGIQEVYHAPFIKIILEHQGSIYNLIGISLFVILGIPLYIMDVKSHVAGYFSLLTVLNNAIWIICFANFTIAGKIHNKTVIKPQSEIKEFISLRDELFVINAYSELVNTFLSSVNIVSSVFKQLILEFFEFNPILFEGCKVNQDGSIDFGRAMENIERIYEDNKIQDVCMIYSALLSRLFNLYATMTSYRLADVILSERYQIVQCNYENSPLFFYILRSLPKGILENEKIALLPRDELETSVKERTKELEESRNYINNVIVSMMDMLIVVDPQGKIKTVNKITEKLLGYNEDELVGHPISLILSSNNSSFAETSEFIDLFKHESVRNLETVYLSKDCRNIPVLFSGSIMKDDYNEIIGIVCVAQDITELKHAESVLKESEEKHRNVFENANEGIIVIQDDKLKLINPKASEIFGYLGDKINSRNLIMSIHLDDRQAVLDHYRESLLGKEINLYQFRVIDNNAKIKWMEASAIKINWEGEPASLVFINDITERRKIEDELLKAQKLESIGILAGEIAHDFNNFLQGIVGNISLAQTLTKPGEKIYERLLEAEKASESAKNLTQQLLTFAKGGEPILKLASVNEIAKDATNLGLLGSNVKGVFHLSNDLWNAEVDKGQISQVINNLVINAKQATPNGGIIKVITENKILNEDNVFSLKAGHYVKISIEDHGVGISEENLTKIFDPFFTTKPNGNGLGLATCYSIIKKHNGNISVESKVGIGTTFNIHIPALPDKKLEVVKKKEEIEFSGSGKILVMDDEGFIRELASAMLSSMGYKVAFAEDGNEALDKYKDALQAGEPFDLVIMDLTIPGGMGGKETIIKLKEIDPNAKAIVSSGYSNDFMLSEFVKYGFSGILAKPYRRNELIDVLVKVLGA